MAANTQPELYSWAGLNHPDSIRLLTLHPDLSSSDEIAISIHEVRMSTSPIYEAVSYCWATEDGDDSRNCTLSCEGTLIFITRNCEAALGRIRNSQDRILWVDAICINRASDNERSHQVGIMGSIYKNASRVLVYLGEPNSDIDDETGLEAADIFLDFLCGFFKEVSDLSAQEIDIESSSRYQEFFSHIQPRESDPQQLSPLIRELRDISSRRWWRRIWVVQEAYLALNQVERFLGFAYCSAVSSPGDDKLNYIFNVLNSARGLQASDPRDKVYGLIGLIDPDTEHLPSPDYTKSTSEVFNLVSRNLLEESNSLEVLYYLPGVESSRHPSWVIDWAQSCQNHPNTFSRGVMDAASTSVCSCIILDDNSELRVTGKFTDEVFELALLGRGGNASRINCWQTICHLSDRTNAYAPTGETMAQVLGMILSEFRKKYDFDVMERCQQDFLEFYSTMMSEKALPDIEKDIKKAENRAIDFLNARGLLLSLCISKRGYLGLVPRQTQKGDQIALLSGGRLPFVLRPVENHFRVIGGCYVHGYMKGEAWPKNQEDLEQIIIG